MYSCVCVDGCFVLRLCWYRIESLRIVTTWFCTNRNPIIFTKVRTSAEHPQKIKWKDNHISQKTGYFEKKHQKKIDQRILLVSQLKISWRIVYDSFPALAPCWHHFQKSSSHSHFPRLPFLLILSNTRPYRIYMGTGGLTAAWLPIENNLSSPHG